ncbi:hypothetical protein PAAG_08493 [Paracoccidioides lutzii Pb01]|uniref:Uncharacterized protein n=1 Tax=Paracoccidioides lutzii (strain ATCC MYA-826 / Pb01) TaxID=502779 RepID=C1HCK2_PARBA|nr:hypothetical protein PAAG_08493 [Paracoccidioides lutzii Pb01]EEH38766.2 hypothetical protein PAAG_08493 [Paracoccidioides lutzii Pb01]
MSRLHGYTVGTGSFIGTFIFHSTRKEIRRMKNGPGSWWVLIGTPGTHYRDGDGRRSARTAPAGPARLQKPPGSPYQHYFESKRSRGGMNYDNNRASTFHVPGMTVAPCGFSPQKLEAWNTDGGTALARSLRTVIIPSACKCSGRPGVIFLAWASASTLSVDVDHLFLLLLKITSSFSKRN